MALPRKIKHEQYEAVVSFKSENFLSITAQFLMTGEHFRNPAVELIRINKQTVIAALQRKSENNLRCEFEQLVQDGKKCLQIVFIVNFDFLPEFRQEIRLQKIDLKESLKEINFVSMQASIDEMSRAIENIQERGVIEHKEIGSVTTNSGGKNNIWSSNVNEGKYILRMSGSMTNSSSTSHPDSLRVFIQVPGEKQLKEIVFRTHNMASYYFPFFTSQVLQCGKGQLKVNTTTTMASMTIMNMHFALSRVTEVN